MRILAALFTLPAAACAATTANYPRVRAGGDARRTMTGARALALGAALTASIASADGPGSRIRSSPEVPQLLTQSAPGDQAKACERLRGERRKRCLLELREAAAPRGSNGPEATGTGSGLANTGISGGAASGTAAPR